MSEAPFRIVHFDGKQHRRDAFDSACEALNRYLRNQVTKM